MYTPFSIIKTNCSSRNNKEQRHLLLAPNTNGNWKQSAKESGKVKAKQGKRNGFGNRGKARHSWEGRYVLLSHIKFVTSQVHKS